MTGWRPLSRRGTEPSPDEDALYEGAQAHLAHPLLYWLDSLFVQVEEDRANHYYNTTEAFMAAERKAGRIAARLRLDLRSVPAEEARPRTSYLAEWSVSRALAHLADEAGEAVLLDVIDAALADGVAKEHADELDRLLTDGGSAWRVADDMTALQRRVNPAATDALQSTSGGAAAHLKAAWAATYGRHPSPTRAYSEAIKAVETAYVPIVVPNDRIGTLGKVIGELKSQQKTHWQLAISTPEGSPADISILLDMLRLLWEGQTDRHGGGTPAAPVTATAAEAAVHLAVTLVQWCESGVFQRANGPRPASDGRRAR